MRKEARLGSLKILIYTHSFAPNVGGIETAVMSLALGLIRTRQTDVSGCADVTVVTATPQGGYDDGSLPLQTVRRPNLLELTRLIRAADVIHLAGPCFVPMLAGLALRKPVVVEHHGFQTICPNGQLLHEPTQTPCPGHFMAGRHRECIRCNAGAGLVYTLRLWLLTFLRRWLCMCTEANITPTRWLSTLLRLPRMITIHHGLPVYGSDRLLSAGLSPPVIAYMGRLVTAKGVHVLLQAAQRLKAKGVAFTLRIIGEGPERGRLEAKTQALGLADRVKFVGYQPDDRLHEALAGVGIIVMPSLGGEVFGLVAAENMMRGILPIVSSGGALAEVVGDTGLTFPPGDEEALAGCLEQTVRQPEKAKTERQRAQERAMTWFGDRCMVAQHLALYRELGENHSHRRHWHARASD